MVVVIFVVLCVVSVVGWIRYKPSTLGHMVNDAVINHSAECGCDVCVITECYSEDCWTCNNEGYTVD